jgi:hypothetical protein
MWLSRVTPNPAGWNPISAVCCDFTIGYAPRSSQPAVVADFLRFGHGSKRRPDFQVAIDWQDVERMIEKFCEVGQLEALALYEARRLAEAARELGWEAPSSGAPQSN